MLSSFQPKEVLFQKGKERIYCIFRKYYTFSQEDWVYTEDAANDRLMRHFETKSLKGFGVHELQLGIISAGAILHYLDFTQHHRLSHVVNLCSIEEDNFVWLDRFTIRNLELFSSINEGAKRWFR
ncbi:MAG: hypothetical protein IPF54_13160 [Draconibacterium sp.]|nr:hypothetical protein [Draconibacterium sp.]